uniref:Uncharacterized protein n=1 Tax=Magallana gigas TaxID=29159 RepID=K1QM74_MAGGI
MRTSNPNWRRKSTFEKDENRIKSGAAKGYSPRTRQNRWKELNSLEKRCNKRRKEIQIVGDECVYSKIDQILNAKFNKTTQICCRSGVHARYREEMEIGCCGGKY